MDLAPLVLTALGIVFIIQILIIIQIIRINALLGNLRGSKSEFSSQKSSKKDRSFRRDTKVNKKQAAESRPKTQAPVSSVEKSLRDINLRLKNAERDQERARKKLSVSDSRGSGKRSDRERGKKPIKRRGQQKGQKFQKKAPPKHQKVKTRTPVSPPPSTSEEVSLDSLKPAQLSVSDAKVINSPEENFGRGSKVIVKRRSLSNSKENGSDERPAEVNGSETSEEQKISFGRR